ncbi:SDR family NAD(P)-dependent oxidoreductase [Novacetimonas pomaceti]|uniref:Oxidoreductase n=1 Tax=Novacetimonas pomaceti TaxID=2021998 RepID=A0ABX5P4J5_9PROT|nr:SDR family NAD(P)-dependent oxidoreductase [Novacetimonas pomaceti]MBV1834175.1 SDR family NAD(P)-dependent oxidoreductase [Novacetimonas pomaceti]PYD48700.1 oxidoreductase [Novacetimonas pomaceti]
MEVRPGQNMNGTPAWALITGASGGIGAELARLYARRGWNLLLWGRDEGRLEAVARDCRRYGGDVRIRALDLQDGHAAIASYREDDARTPIDLAILAAGLGDMKTADDVTEKAETVLELGLVNYATPSAMAAAAAEAMVRRGRGHIVLVGSVAAFHAIPFAAAYSGSKAGLKRFAESLHMALSPHGVGVTLVSPGFVDTAMSRRVVGFKPFLQTAPSAARQIARAVERNRAHVVFPFLFSILRLVDVIVPWPFKRWILSRLKAGQVPRGEVSQDAQDGQKK